MRYDVYCPTKDNSARFSLGLVSDTPLIVMGLNPSVATDEEPDHTITRVERFASTDGCRGFIVFNLYPLRSPSPGNLPPVANAELRRRNIQEITTRLAGTREWVIWAACGDDIERRDYLFDCLTQILKALDELKINVRWQHRGSLTKRGNPRHPARLASASVLQEFDVRSYVHAKVKVHSSP